MSTESEASAWKSETVKNGIQLLRYINYLRGAYGEAMNNSNGTLSRVTWYGVIIGVALFLVFVVITGLLRSIPEDSAAWLLIGACTYVVLMPLLINLIVKDEYDRRWNRIFGLEFYVENLLREFVFGEILKVGCDAKIAEYRENFEFLARMFRNGILSPRKIDYASAKKILDKDFTCHAMVLCKQANLSYSDGLPDSVLANLDENGNLKKEVHEKYFSK